MTDAVIVEVTTPASDQTSVVVEQKDGRDGKDGAQGPAGAIWSKTEW